MDVLDLTFFREGPVALVQYIVACLPVRIPVMKEAWESTREKDYFSEPTLAIIATLGASHIGEYPEEVAMVSFYTVGELFQDKMVDKTKRNIGALLDVRPEKVLVFREGNPVIESPKKIEVGETIKMKAGERVPLDGTTQNGAAAFNTAALTDGSVPRNIRKGEEVLTGMIVTDKAIQPETTGPSDKSALARILELVQNASERKVPVELSIRKFVRTCTSIVIALAVLTVLCPFVYSLVNLPFVSTFSDWLYRALTFLVISRPCALMISIPSGYFRGTGVTSRLGILFRGGNYLDTITKISTVVFDKIGTLTGGTFEVQACKSIDGVSEEELVKLVASVEDDSTRPIAKVVVNYAKEQNIECIAITGTKEFAGCGLEATIDGAMVLIDNCRLLSKFDMSYPKELLEITDTIMVCAVGNRYAGYLLLADALEKDARAAIDNLKALNIENIQILFGDKQSIVTDFVGKFGVSKAYGDLLPEGKVGHLEELRQDEVNRIAFAGDGVNDVPVLTLSYAGIATGRLGSDAATETTDVVIQADQPLKAAEAVKVGKLIRRTIQQNVSLVFGVKLLVLVLGIDGIVALWEAVFVDVGIALLAIMSAVGIQKMVKQEKDGKKYLFG